MPKQPRAATDWAFRKQLERDRAEWVAQHGPGCVLCGTVPKTRGLQWDHDHATGETRGWLCHRCNRALPTWVDPAWVFAAWLYLSARGSHTLGRHPSYLDYARDLEETAASGEPRK